MQGIFQSLASFLMFGVLTASLAAQTGADRYDTAIQAKVVQELAKKQEFLNLQSSTEDGIVTLTGTVELYQQKLDAAKKIRKSDQVQGVRNLIEVSSTVPDGELAAQLDRKLYYDRIGYDNLFNFVTVSVEDGVAKLGGETYNDVGRDSALELVNHTPGVKDVVDNIKVAPVSIFDDRIRVSALKVIYRDPVLSRYAIDPALPIRIVVDNGKLTLCGTVMNQMDKQVAGMRANQVFGVFTVQNNLQVQNKA
jgi:hyperosmotically inducible periplasmic protein